MMFVCEQCLKYVRKRKTLARHKNACPLSTPGDEIYRQPPARAPAAAPPACSRWTAPRRASTASLCLLSLTLDHKTLALRRAPFLFYVLCERRSTPSGETTFHIVGYFSKEKHTREGQPSRASCTLPPYQRKGYGRFQLAPRASSASARAARAPPSGRCRI